MRNYLLKKIPNSVLLLNRFFCLGLVVFFGYRLLFFFKFKTETNYTLLELVEALFFGIRFDNALLCYSFFIPLLLLFINEAFVNKYKILKTLSVGLISVVFLVYQFVCAANVPYYKQFGNHLNKNALLWKGNASFVFGFIFENSSYWGYLLVFFPTAIVTIYFIKKISKKYDNDNLSIKNIKPFSLVLWLVLYSGLLVFGARGTVSKKTVLHEGFSIISDNQFVNNVCLNPNYAFFNSLVDSKGSTEYKEPKDIAESFRFTKSYLKVKSNIANSIDRIDSSETINPKPNIVLVIMESMSLAKLGYYKSPNLTPNIHNLNKESVFFDNFFSSGIHTFNGLFSSTTGFPSLYAEHSLEQYTKSKFDGLGTIMKSAGYQTYFGTTHDSQFDNMEGFFRLNNFDNIINQSTMPSNKVISTLGVPDHVLFDELINVVNKQTNISPFLAVLMTSTDHGPWIIPTDIDFKPSSTNEQERCAQYADWAIGNFISNAKKQSWYNNTVFLFVGDHGVSNGPYEMKLTFNHVPFIIHQPNRFKADTISSPCYQPDIVPTIMGIAGITFQNKTFGINVLKKQHPFVVFSADDKLGLVDKDGFYFYKTLSNNQRYLRKYKNIDEADYLDKYPQKVDSMEKGMKSLFDAAQYLIHTKYSN